MSNVYFLPLKEFDPALISDKARQLFEILLEREGHVFQEEVPIKVHFGERGNSTFIPPDCFDGIIDAMQERGVKPSFIETNVLYRGSRTTREKHLEVAQAHGFTRLPIIIADGDHGEAYDLVPIDGDFFKEVKLGSGYAPYNQFVVLAHFKGHVEAGFGGSMKQLAMGFAARGGKLDQHATIKPYVNQEICVACGICQGVCDYSAITIERKASIDHTRCVGCAGCVAACPLGAIETEWSEKDFFEKLAEYALGAAKGRDNVYLNFLFNVTALCDCAGKHMDLVADHMGIFASKDPVAIDTCCLDLLQKQEGKALFDEGRATIRHAEKLGLGSSEYQLIIV